MIRRLLFLIGLGGLCVSWDWEEYSLKNTSSPRLRIQEHWVKDTFQEDQLRRRLVNQASPLVTETLVIQGNALDGVKAYDKKSGRLQWSFLVPSGVAGPILLHKEALYFGGKDGFFYSLFADTGALRWKYFSSSENTGQPFIYQDQIYFVSQDQKMYVLDLEGKLLWLYARKIPSRQFSVRTYTSPVADKNSVYVSFQDSYVVALSRKDFSLQWEKKIKGISTEPLQLKEGCLLVPVLDKELLCLNPANGKSLWSIKGGSALRIQEARIYQFHKGHAYAYQAKSPLSKNKPKLLWKQKLDISYPFPPALALKELLIYGSPSKGELLIINKSDGTLLAQHPFGKGLAGPVTVDEDQKTAYFFSVDAYLHKISLKRAKLNQKPNKNPKLNKIKI